MFQLMFIAFVTMVAWPNAVKKKPKFRFRVATVNDDWETVASNIHLVMPHADVIFFQEAKRDHLAQMVDLKKWFVFQDWTNQSTAGSAVMIRREVFPHIGAHGLTLGVEPHGRRMLTRYIAWAVAWHVALGQKFWFSSGHRPPIRYKGLWPLYDAALAARVRIARMAGRVIVHGSDTNHKNPTALARQCGLKLVVPDKSSIDAFLVSHRVNVLSVTRLPEWTSDHHPVVAHLEV